MFLTFLTVVLLIMGGVHGYIFQRLVVNTAIPAPTNAVLGWVFLAAVSSLPLSFIASRVLDKSLARYFVVPVYVWLGFIFQTFFLVLAVDTIRVLGKLGLAVAGVGPLFATPDEALSAWRLVAGAAVGGTLALTGLAIWWGLTRLEVKRMEVSLPRLSRSMDGFTILQLSDLHLDLVHGRKWLSHVVARANALEPDLVVITGDLAEGSVAQFSREAEPLADLAAPQGVFFVTGNHEYFHDLDGWLAFLTHRGIRVLRNEGVSLGGDGGSFYLAGVDDHDGSRLAPGHGPDIGSALENRNPDQEVVLLAHQPRIIRELAGRDVGLVLSGHTHGGQIWPFSYLVYLQQPFVRGLEKVGETALYISSGTGFWGPPMRLGTTAEITMITLRSPDSAEGE